MSDYIKREDEEELRAFVENILLDKREEMTSMIDKRGDDYIKRKDAIEKFAGVTLIECDKTTAESPYSLSAAEKFFSDIPSADVVEVVRCKDCRYALRNVFKRDKDVVICDMHGVYRKIDDYCSDGERAEE